VPVLYLLELQLAPGYRRMGIGSLLMQTVQSFGLGAKKDALLLTVHLENSAARAFYDVRRDHDPLRIAAA
jgi:ribosomal protein S18 acetylase RimI-like enzyme